MFPGKLSILRGGKIQERARSGVKCKKNGEHFADEHAKPLRNSVALLKVREELETELRILLPSHSS